MIQIIMLTRPGCCLFSLQGTIVFSCDGPAMGMPAVVLLALLVTLWAMYSTSHWRWLGCMLCITYEALQDSQPSILIHITLHEDDTNSNQQTCTGAAKGTDDDPW